jgi:AGZA family xanthine/uracil permease-like MFS transporter
MFLERLFQLKQHHTSARVEILGGVTTFATMAYVIVVNPAILANAGIPVGPSTVATILTAVFGCVLMGLYANRPIAVAPYMGENAFLAFGLAAFGDISWQQRLGTVFIAGAAFLVLTLLGIRTWLAAALSSSMKHSFAVGIGLFLLVIGLYQTGIVTSGVVGMPVQELAVKDGKVAQPPPVPMKLGNLRDPLVLLAVAGFLVMALLLYWRIKAAILIGIALTALAGFLLGHGRAPERVFALPWDQEYDLNRLAFNLDIKGVFFDAGGTFRLTFMPILLTLLLISFLDTLATLVALSSAEKADKTRAKETFASDFKKPMIVDSLSCMFGALVGTSTSGAYVESAAGIRAGARTGLAAVVTGLLFAAALFFMPLLGPLQALTFAYGPALMIVGVLMFGAVRHIDFEDLAELVPALTAIAMMVFTYNIANGLTAGLILHPVMKIACGKARAVHPGGLVLAAVCLVYYCFGIPH